jgi:hypothetical protein
MKRILFAGLLTAIIAALPVNAAFFQAAVNGGGGGGGSFSGLLNTYTGATWGVSAYKLNSSYAGSWGTVQRQSDSATQAIGFLSNGKVDVASFNTFCASTYCYLNTWVDQVNGINASDASTAGHKARVIVDENSLLAVCPQPGSKMTTTFSSTVNTAQQHLFMVANLHTLDYKWSQANLPTWVTTGNITNGSANIASMASQVGLSTANNQTQLGTSPGIYDSAGFIPHASATSGTGQSYLNTLPTGTTGTMAFAPGNIGPTGTQTGDTLTITNSVGGGVWIMNGPAGAQFDSVAYWGVGAASASSNQASDFNAARNGSPVFGQFRIDNGMRSQMAVWDYDTSTTQLNYDAVSLGTIATGGNITYSTNVGMTLFANASGSESASNSCFETMVLYPSTQASRVAMATFLQGQGGNTFPFAPNTSDGFTMAGSYVPNAYTGPNNAYGQNTYGPDVLGQSWHPQSGGYVWPSIARATNINNTATMWRFIVQPGDSDANITIQERSEIDNALVFTPGQHFSIYYTFNFEQYQTHNGDWCYGGQVHYNDGAGSPGTPDLVTFSCLNGQIQFQTQCCESGGNPVTTNCGSPFTLTVGTTYAVEIEGFWSTNHTTDTITINAGPRGSTLPLICSKGPSALWDNDTGAYLKAGLYQGFPWSNPGTTILRQTNMQISTTQNAFSAYITTQPAEPTHP